MEKITLFKDTVGYDSHLGQAAMVAARDVLAIKKGERALIVTNPDAEVFQVSQAVFDAIYELGGIPTMAVQTIKTQIDEANPEVLGSFLAKPHAGISISAEKLGKDPDMMKTPFKAADGREYTHAFDKLLHGTKTMKAFWSPNITVDMFKRTVPINYEQLRSRCTRLKNIIDEAVKVRVTSPGGT
ncbi:MAG TPA: hypothetical protein ENN76_02695, partial [Euryarchaeota archaeon]|nr:hypothetical protein [Euryarchaeota archaeon]